MPATLSLNDIRKRCARFVVDWKDEPGEERQQAQGFVRDLLRAFGIRRTKAALYERRAKRTSTGGQGYIDALIPGLCLIEMKSRGRDLGKAEDQALDYIDDLPDVEQPRWVVTSDFARIRVLDLGADPDEKGDLPVHEFTLEDLPREAERLSFLAGYQTRSFGSKEQEKASIKAAQLMATLYEALEGSGYSDHEASVFLVRTLFSLYADDAGMWERDLFYEFLETRTSADGTDLGPKLAQLYQVMNQPTDRRPSNLDELMARFPYVNGGVFAEPLMIPTFDHEMRDLLLEACAFNWSAISPAIFGSLFQAVKSPEARRSLGEHYTTETNILKTINPLFMDELRERFTQEYHSKNGLEKLRKELGEIRVLDPACGCGNFLVVAYRELRALDLDILLRLKELEGSSNVSTLFFTEENLPVTLDHFYGIEIEEWPARIAATALHLVDHQANQRMELALGGAPNPLPLQTLTNIHVGNALRMQWGKVLPPSPGVRVVGNPPFIGHKSKNDSQTDDLKLVWGAQYNGYLDYVTGWYKKAADYLAQTPAGRFAFVSTNSIAQGLPVAPLFRPLFERGWRIRFAHQTFGWSSEAPGEAHVHCVIIGMDRAAKASAVLFTYENVDAQPVAVPVRVISDYLTDGPNVFLTKRRKPLSPSVPEVFYGSMPIDDGHLIVEPEDYPTVAADPIAAKYLRPLIGAKQLIQGKKRWCLWMADDDFDPADLRRSPVLKERVEACRAWRSVQTPTGDAYKYRDTPHLFRPNKNQPTSTYICIPRHFSAERRFLTAEYFLPDVISSDANFTAADPEGFIFAVISSSMFITWQEAIGGRIKSDYRFSKDIVWNNLPLPLVPDKQRQQIIAAGQHVLEVRAQHPERSLADHYNPLAMDPDLLKAHAALDRAVDKAFGARRALSTNEQRLGILLKRYAEMTAAES